MANTQSDNLSNILGGISTATDSASASNTASASASGSNSGSGSGSASQTGSNSRSGSGNTDSASQTATLSGAPSLGTATQTLTDAPSLTSGLDIPHLTGLPTLSGYYSYPPPTVPPKAQAPYLKSSGLPENFVFIVVGAVIAFVAILIIVWRVLTSWSMNRRFRRSDGGTSKGTYTPLKDFKNKPAATSTHDMKDLGNLPKNFSSSAPNLFFSPTADAARHSKVPSARDSRHMPGGHYRTEG